MLESIRYHYSKFCFISPVNCHCWTSSRALIIFIIRMLKGGNDNISPLKQNRKRSRFEDDGTANEDPKDMELDDFGVTTSFRSIGDLSLEELKIAQKIAQEKLKLILFLQVEIPSEPVGLNPFVDPSTQLHQDVDELMVAKDKVDKDPFGSFDQQFQHHAIISQFSTSDSSLSLLQKVCKLILKQSNSQPNFFMNATTMTSRSTELKKLIESENEEELIITNEDTPELIRILVNCLMKLPSLISSNLYVACQGILAINQATGLPRRIGGTSIKTPTSMVKELLRNIILLIPSLNRQLLQFMVEFAIELCQQVVNKARNSWARQVSGIFATLVEKQATIGCHTPSSTPSYGQPSWSALFFELLVQCHGLHCEPNTLENEKRFIWSIDEPFKRELNSRYVVLKTPSRKSRSLSTPRRSTGRTLMKGVAGTSLKRNLFKCKIQEESNSPSFISKMDGKEFPTSPTVQGPLDRQRYSKRLRLK
ncbi:hypothetical protein BC833DRAFT_590884 [Globomyces pollinis-pini]|nr:hypothetical protein BC833DRAFT_590884 [Globomyces pollinis-pini]